MPTPVKCEVAHVDLTNEEDVEVPGLEVTCSRCGHRVESFGQRGRSLRRCLAVMREECPRGEENFYQSEEVLDD